MLATWAVSKRGGFDIRPWYFSPKVRGVGTFKGSVSNICSELELLFFFPLYFIIVLDRMH